MIENPTLKQLKTIKGIVYIIKNRLNDMSYIGKTKHRFSDRYSSCKWWKYTNQYLSNAAKHYGIDNFKISILESGIKDNVELIRKEKEYILKFNSLSPNGYNFIEENGEVNREFTEEFKLKIAIAGAKGKIYKIKEINTGEIKEFRCPKEIIDKYNISQQNLAQLFKGEIRRLKGICLPETNPDQWSANDTLKILIDQNGNKYQFYNCNKFGRENECSRNGVLQVIRGKTLTTKSKDGRIFRLEGTSTEKKKYIKSSVNPGQKYKLIVLTRITDGQDVEIHPSRINEFCNSNNIDKRSIYALTGKEQKTAKGFKLKKIVFL